MRISIYSDVGHLQARIIFLQLQLIIKDFFSQQHERTLKMFAKRIVWDLWTLIFDKNSSCVPSFCCEKRSLLLIAIAKNCFSLKMTNAVDQNAHITWNL